MLFLRQSDEVNDGDVTIEIVLLVVPKLLADLGEF
jgi:hypothetical protein